MTVFSGQYYNNIMLIPCQWLVWGAKYFLFIEFLNQVNCARLHNFYSKIAHEIKGGDNKQKSFLFDDHFLTTIVYFGGDN